MFGLGRPRTAGTVRDGMEYEEGGDAFCRAGAGAPKAAAIDAEKAARRPWGLAWLACPPGRDKPNHAVS